MANKNWGFAIKTCKFILINNNIRQRARVVYAMFLTIVLNNCFEQLFWTPIATSGLSPIDSE